MINVITMPLKIKKLVYEKYKNKCVFPCTPRGMVMAPLHIHHIDHNRKNNDLSNLILVCRTCHFRLHAAWNLIHKLRLGDRIDTKSIDPYWIKGIILDRPFYNAKEISLVTGFAEFTIKRWVRDGYIKELPIDKTIDKVYSHR